MEHQHHDRRARVSPAVASDPTLYSMGTYRSLSGPATISAISFSPSSSSAQKHKDKKKKKKLSASANDICNIFGVFFAILVRALLLVYCLLTVFLVVSQMGDTRFWSLAACSAPLIVEGIYTVYSRLGQERKWVCWCFVSFLIACVPPIWILELERLKDFESAFENATVSVSVPGLTTEIKLDPDLALNIAEQCLVFLMILCRWLLPCQDVITRDQLSQLLFVFIAMASDVMELFELFDEPVVRQNRELTYTILAIWTLSLFQFTLVLTMSQSPKKARIAMEGEEEPEMPQPVNRQKSKIVQKFTYTEMWSLMVSICMQDGPFLAMRLYILVRYELINYTIVFYVCKNVLVVVLLLYRLLVICIKRIEHDDDDEDKDPIRYQDIRLASKNGANFNKLNPSNDALKDTSESKPAKSQPTPSDANMDT